MLTHSSRTRLGTKPGRFPAAFRRQAGFVRFPFSAPSRFVWRRSVCNESDLHAIIEPVVDIEEAIRSFADSQPAQLYRGGA
ncbi:hypothetical protein [Thiobaca trueperi]|uniref:Uncharacterized protein n=1 Tax=Thiobaca trueperi TaxID=127458 RepID=A0A4R3N0G8_9GAMM|nr:hypothetical protein [Thiobaca trueperi]TCT20099.1 hypothetical protein EDC35_10623 [Thiobaca trueperi]